MLQRITLAGGASPVAHESDRIHLQKQRDGAPLGCRFRVKHVGCAEALRKGLDPSRVLLQQIAQVRRRSLGGRDGQEHILLWLLLGDQLQTLDDFCESWRILGGLVRKIDGFELLPCIGVA